MHNSDFDYSQFHIFEGMTSISSIIHSIENFQSKRKIVSVYYNADKKKSKYNELKFLEAKSKLLGFSLVGISHSEIDKLAQGKTHGGFVALCTKVEIPSLSADNIIEDGFYIVLDGIEDPFNFAYAIRSLYAAGANGIIVPTFRFSNSYGLICKSSAGTSELIDIFECEISSAVDIFKSKGYRVASAGIRDSISLYDADLKKPLLLIVGGEKRGISSDVLSKSDVIVRIDYGKSFKGSLTASSAATVLAFEVYRQNKS